ncbi:hypothetical protein VPH35_132144 [Triticum aestivum]
MAAPCTSITDDRLAVLLEEIFLRLPTPADLVHASAACVPFRQIATGNSFLRRFRKEHSPSFIGFMDWHGFRPALPPHTTAPIASAVARAADFTFSFLPSPTPYPTRCSQTPAAGASAAFATAASSSTEATRETMVQSSSRSSWCVTRYTGDTTCFHRSLTT